MRTNTQKHTGKVRRFQAGKGDIRSKSGHCPDIYAHSLNITDFIIKNFRRQPIVRNSKPEHAACLIGRFKNSDLISF